MARRSPPGSAERIADGARHRPGGAARRVRRALAHVGRARRHRRAGRRAGRPARAREVGVAPAQPARRRSALLLGVLRAGGCVVAINPRPRRRARPRDDIAALDLAVRRRRAGRPRELVAATGRRATAVARRATSARADRRRAPRRDRADAPTPPGRRRADAHERHDRAAKRIDLTYETLERVLAGRQALRVEPRRRRCGCAAASRSSTRRSSTSAACSACCSASTTAARSALLERFTVDGWVDAVRRHRPATASLVPAALRMVLEADLDPADLAQPPLGRLGHRAARPRRRRRLHGDATASRCSSPTRATEFGGGVAGWNLADHRAVLGDQARAASAGRTPGCELRVVDPDDGARRSAPTRRACSR